MIIPTIGRVVLVNLHENQQQPYPALICFVHNPRLINVGGFDCNGKPFTETSLQLLQENEEIVDVPTSIRYAHWMDYQIKAAKKEQPAPNI